MKPEYAKNSIEEVPFAQYMEQYCAMDPVEAGRRTGIPYDEAGKKFTLRMMQKTYEVTWPDMQVRCMDVDQDGYAVLAEETDAKIFAIRFLLNGLETKPAGKFLTYRELPNGELYYQQFSGRCLARLAYGFGFKLDKFAEILEKIGGRKLSYGDVSYEVEFVNNHYVRFILWMGDDEFPPSSQILFSDNFPLSFDTYDLAVVGDISINVFKKM